MTFSNIAQAIKCDKLHMREIYQLFVIIVAIVCLFAGFNSVNIRKGSLNKLSSGELNLHA